MYIIYKFMLVLASRSRLYTPFEILLQVQILFAYKPKIDLILK